MKPDVTNTEPPQDDINKIKDELDSYIKAWAEAAAFVESLHDETDQDDNFSLIDILDACGHYQKIINDLKKENEELKSKFNEVEITNSILTGKSEEV